ncbi:MAG: YdeI/OmpD-associated family protein [Terracidiphilus sp.]
MRNPNTPAPPNCGRYTSVLTGWATIVPESELYSRIRCFSLRDNSMSTVRISGGVVHDLPADLRKALVSDAMALAAWEDITPLARNEWICWTISVKKDETRRQHVERVCSELKEGMRRPCCWPGCKHR